MPVVHTQLTLSWIQMALEGRHRVQVVQVSIYIELETILGKEKKWCLKKKNKNFSFKFFKRNLPILFFFPIDIRGCATAGGSKKWNQYYTTARDHEARRCHWQKTRSKQKEGTERVSVLFLLRNMQIFFIVLHPSGGRWNVFWNQWWSKIISSVKIVYVILIILRNV